MSDSRATFRAGFALLDTAAAEARAEHALSLARVARLQAAAELERLGRLDEAAALISEVRAEQEQLAP